jgi:hypothetical protein
MLCMLLHLVSIYLHYIFHWLLNYLQMYFIVTTLFIQLQRLFAKVVQFTNCFFTGNCIDEHINISTFFYIHNIDL